MIDKATTSVSLQQILHTLAFMLMHPSMMSI